MDMETAKAINNVSKRLNEVEKKLESFLLGKHKENRESIAVTDGGLVDVAEAVSVQDEAITELAGLLAGLASEEEKGKE